MKVVTDDTFEEFVATGNVVVDCWAEWCGPCMDLGRVLTSAERDLPGIKIGKLDVDGNRAVPKRYAVMSIPTLLIFRDGKHVTSLIGSMTRSEVIKAIKEKFGG